MTSFFKIPNIITLLNLICGSIAIYHILNNDIIIGTYFIIAAAVLDFLDGFAARLFNQASEIGKQLDSLADVISFGLAPGFIFFQLLSASGHEVGGEILNLNMLAFLLPAFGALRLAKFNIDESQSVHFKGLPTPAMAMYAIGMVYWYENDAAWQSVFFNTEILIIQIVVLSLLMISNLNLIALKFTKNKIKDNIDTILLLAVSILLFLLFNLSALPMIILTYIVISILSFNLKIFNKK